MISRGFRLTVTLAAAVLATATLAVPAAAQSQNDLRRENQRLKTEVEDLTNELAAARQEIETLKAEVERLRQALAAGTASPEGRLPDVPPEPEIVTVDESKPDASPRALLRAIQASYAEATAELDMGETVDSTERLLYLRELDRWVSRVNREFKSPIEWNVEIVNPPVPVGRGFVLRLQAVDPQTAVKLGDPFDAVISRSLFARLRQHERRFGLDDVLILKGILVPRVQINADRFVEGVFDNPRFIGPFAEFNLTVTAQTILPVPEPDEEEEEATGEESGQTRPDR